MIRPLSRLWIVRVGIPALGDLALMFASLCAVIALRSRADLHRGLVQSFIPLFGLFLGVFYAAGLYELRRVRDFVALVGGLMVSAAACTALGASYFYVVSPYVGQTPKTFLLLTVLASHAGLLLWRRAILAATDYSLSRLRLLVLADPAHLSHLRAGEHTRFGEELDLAERMGPDVELVVADSAWIEDHWAEGKAVFAQAVERGVAIVSLDLFYESMYGKVSPAHGSDPSWALEHILPRADGAYFKARRLFDLAASVAGLIVLSPLMLLTAAMIRVVDGMPPLYGQERVGYLGRTFTLWKFRTMRPDADAEGPFARRSEGEDNRVTRLGGFLRRYRLDEFPQLWNVARGEMSLVGPRPEWVKEVEVLEKRVPNYHLRHLVPPGITGWAQVYFRATSDPKDSLEKHNFDLYYLKHFSPALDLTILLKTFKRVFVSDARVSSAATPFPRAARGAPSLVDISSIISRG